MNQDDLAKALDELTGAQESYRAAEQQAAYARNAATDALNRLNRAQGQFDELTAKLRKASPRESDWRARERRGEAVPA